MLINLLSLAHGAMIYGSFTEETAKELAMLLKSGAFSAPVEFIEESHIGPSLGQESINKGFFLCYRFGLFLLFSLFVYKLQDYLPLLFCFITCS